MPENLVITGAVFDGQAVNNVTARVRASETLIRTLSDRSMYLQVDVEDMGPGVHPVQLTDQMVMGRPPGAEITEIFPRVVDIEIEQLMIRPDVVWFGEVPAEDCFRRAGRALESCDVLLVVGTSGLVYPAAAFPSQAKQNGAFVIEVNPEASAITPIADISLRGPAGEVLPKLVERFRNTSSGG